MSERFKAFWLGLFLIGALAILAWFILFLRPSVGDGKTTLRVRFTNVEKIVEGTRVNFAGRPVGQVTRIEEVPDPRDAPADPYGNLYIFEVTLKVDSSVSVYSYDEVSLQTQGLFGEKIISILPKAPPPGDPPAINVTNDILYGQSADQLDQVVREVSKVAGQISEALEGVSDLLEGDSLETFREVAKALVLFFNRANDLNLTSSLNEASLAIADAGDEAASFLRQAQEANLIPALQEAASGLAETTETLQELTRNLLSADGTIGKLIQSDDLYWQLSCTLHRLNELLQSVNDYGLLFQFNRKWQREAQQKQNRCCSQLETSFSEELASIGDSLEKLVLEGKRIRTQLPQGEVAEKVENILERVEAIQANFN